jgi:hypothetical protein
LEEQKLRAANLTLEAQIQPRILDKDKQKVLANACRDFPKLGLRIEVVPFVLDLDGARLARQLAATLPNAEVRGPVLPMAGADEGLVVSGDQDVQESVRALAGALNSVGVVATIGPVIDSTGHPERSKLIATRVGLKPLSDVQK